MLYLTIILVCSAIITFMGKYVFLPQSSATLLDFTLGVVLCVVAEILIDAILAFIIRRLPNKWFDYTKKGYSATKKERVFYEKLAIKKWKDKVLELGFLTSFRKNKIEYPTDNEYVSRYILEANYGVLIHLLNIILGFLVIFIYPLKVWYCFGLPVGIVNAFLSLLPLMTLRYNLPKLHNLYNIIARRNNRQGVNLA